MHHYTQLLDCAERLTPPVVLLEDGLGRGTAQLAWGDAGRLHVPWGDPAAVLERLPAGGPWFGAVAYEAGSPPRAMRRTPPLPQPLLECFRPAERIVVPAGGPPRFSSPAAEAVWRAAAAGGAPRPPAGAARSRDRSFTEAGFAAAVRRTLEYIRAGDIYQANLSVAETVDCVEHPFAVYRRLRALNPSPWMGYADFGGWQLVSGSPELLVEVQGGRATARPIAGTRKKTGDAVTDAAMRAELVSDRKEAAEHIMLVDLARNDLGRVAAYGSVRVEALGRIEEYSHVMHLVSDVVATLRGGVGPLETFRALFPGGTITGCPKIRAMEIIAELEPVARGMYTGALGWWEDGAAQWNILIRSAVVRDGIAVIQSGAGIVADSDPEREWKEALRKAAALREAIGLGR